MVLFDEKMMKGWLYGGGGRLFKVKFQLKSISSAKLYNMACEEASILKLEIMTKITFLKKIKVLFPLFQFKSMKI